MPVVGEASGGNWGVLLLDSLTLDPIEKAQEPRVEFYAKLLGKIV